VLPTRELAAGCWLTCFAFQIRVLKKFMERPVQFDHIIIETTGLADPAPVAQV
jgi:G3E family GTPase